MNDEFGAKVMILIHCTKFFGHFLTLAPPPFSLPKRAARSSRTCLALYIFVQGEGLAVETGIGEEFHPLAEDKQTAVAGEG